MDFLTASNKKGLGDKVEMFDKMQNKYVPTVSGLGMHVEVRDPDDKVIMSRVRIINCHGCCHPGHLDVHLSLLSLHLRMFN